MSAATKTAAPVAFGQFSGTPEEFMSTLAYETDVAGYPTSRAMRRQEGDRTFFALLGLQPLAEVAEDELRDAVDRVQEDLPGRWSVYGHDDEPIRDRLDRHFARSQALRVERDRIRALTLEQHQRDLAMGELNRLRIGVSMNRAQVEGIEAEIELMEAELAAQAERLGVKAWP